MLIRVSWRPPLSFCGGWNVGGGGGVCTVIFMSNPTVLRLCCVVLSLVFYRFSVSQITGYFANMGAHINQM